MTIRIRGNATAEELAAVLAVVSHTEVQPDGYTRWRTTRLAVMRHATDQRDETRCATIVP